MQFLKAQSDIIAVVIIVLLAIGLLGFAYTLVFPLIQKNQDRAIEERVKAFFNTASPDSLPAKIEAVANSGGKNTAALDVGGVTRIFPGNFIGSENNTIEFGFQSRVTSYAADRGWISLTGASCPPAAGTIGQDEPSVICVRADNTTSGFYNITYRLHLREVEDAEKKNGFKINLIQHPASPILSSASKTEIRIEFDNRKQQTVGSKNLIVTDIKILLV